MCTNLLSGQFIDFDIECADFHNDILSWMPVRYGIAAAFYLYECAFIGFVLFNQSAVKRLFRQCNTRLALILKQFYFWHAHQIMLFTRIIHTSFEQFPIIFPFILYIWARRKVFLTFCFIRMFDRTFFPSAGRIAEFIFKTVPCRKIRIFLRRNGILALATDDKDGSRRIIE